MRNEQNLPAWLLPGLAHYSQQYVEPLQEEVGVPVFAVQAARDWLLKYARERGSVVLDEAVNSVAQGIADYEEEAGWRTIIPAATSSIVQPRPAPIARLDPKDRASRYFSKEIMNRLSVLVQRNGKVLHVIYVSPEDMADIKEYADLEEIDFGAVRTQIKGKSKVQDLEIRVTPGLGIYGRYNINTASTKINRPFTFDKEGKFNDYTAIHQNELDTEGVLTQPGETQVYAFTKDSKDSMVMPIKQEYTGHWDSTLLRKQRAGFYGWQEFGMAILDSSCLYMGVVDRRYGETYDFKVT